MIISKNRLNAFLMACFAFLLGDHAHASARWAEVIGEATSDYWVEAVEPTSDGGYIVAGCTGSFGAGSSDAWRLKLNNVVSGKL